MYLLVQVYRIPDVPVTIFESWSDLLSPGPAHQVAGPRQLQVRRLLLRDSPSQASQPPRLGLQNLKFNFKFGTASPTVTT